MNGLLGTDLEDPRVQGLLGTALAMLAASGPSPQRRTFGSILGVSGMEGMRQYDQARVLKQRDEELRRRNLLADFQMRKLLESEAEDRAAQEAIRAEAKRLTTPQYPLGTSVVSTDPAKQPQNVTPTLPRFNPLEALSRDVPIKAVGTMQGLFPKPEPYTLKPGEARFVGDKQVAGLPADEKLDALIVKGPDGRPMINPLVLQAKRDIAQAGAARVNVSPQFNTGEKGFKHSVDLASAFKNEPIYKAHQEITSAYGQIKAALEQPSGASDLAAATKFMKLLDPGSVVRESELVMAMSTSGLLDRMSNYANMVITGQKLTPTQRKEFKTMTDKLFDESRSLYNQKRNQYKGVAEKYGLDAEIIPAESNPRVSIGGNVDWRRASDADVLNAIGVDPLMGQTR